MIAAANRRCHPCANARCHQNADPNDGSNDGRLGGTDQITEFVIGDTIEAAVHLQLWPGGRLAQRRRSANGSIQPIRDVYANGATVAKDMGGGDEHLGQCQQTNQLAHLIVLSRETNMDEDRIAGAARKLGDKVQEEASRFSGDTQTQIKGMANRAAGTAQDLYGQAADAARDTATTFDKWLRNTIETQPYTTAIVALGIGWLLGRMHRPL